MEQDAGGFSHNGTFSAPGKVLVYLERAQPRSEVRRGSHCLNNARASSSLLCLTAAS